MKTLLAGAGFLALIGVVPVMGDVLLAKYNEARWAEYEEKMGVAQIQCEDPSSMTYAIDFKRRGQEVRYIPGCETGFFPYEKGEAQLFISFEDNDGDLWLVYQTSSSFFFVRPDTDEG